MLRVAYAISEPDEQRLDGCGKAHEAYPKTLLQVETGRGEMTCLVCLDAREQEGEPGEEYSERMHCGIRDAGIACLFVERCLDKIVTGSEPYAHTG